MNAMDVLNETYEIVSEIGSGAGGVVYHAYHKRLQTDVVIKRIKDEVVGKIQGRSEADVLKNIKHPYLPRVYDFIEADDGIFTVMDYIKGQNLEDALKEHGPYSQAEVLKWAVQIAEALEYLHNQVPPVIHSDIKPANIMLTPSGDICLIDFNISLAIGNEEKYSVGVSGGFSPPEQYHNIQMYDRISQKYNANKVQGSARSSFKTSRNAIVNDDATELLVGGAPSSDGTILLNSNPNLSNKAANTKLCIMSGGTADGRNRNSFHSYQHYIGRGISKSSDIYSAGMCLLTFLTGLLPNGRFEENLNASNCKVHLSQGFEIVLNKMIELNPNDRYADGAELLAAIRNIHKLDKRYLTYKRNSFLMKLVAITSIVIGGLFVAIGGVRYRSEKYSNYYAAITEIDDCIDSGDYDEALELIYDLRENDKDISSYKEEVVLYFAKGDYSTCAKLGEDYLLAQPFYVETEDDRNQLGTIYAYTGNAFYELGDYYSAESYFERALEYEENPIYYRDYAAALARNSKSKKAKKALKNAEENGLDKTSAKYITADIERLEGDNVAAIDHYMDVIEDSDDASLVRRAILSSCDIYISEGNDSLYKAASLIEGYNGSLAEDMSVKMKLATIYIKIAQADAQKSEEYYKKALDVYEDVSRNSLNLFDVGINKGILYMNISEFDKAKEEFMKVIDINPNRYEPYMNLAYLEGKIQESRAIDARDYSAMNDYYNKAYKLYDSNGQDYQMNVLEQYIMQLKDAKWID